MVDYLVREEKSILNVEETKKAISQSIKKSGLTDKQISKEVGVSIQAVNAWKNAKKLPFIDNLFTLSKILGVRVDELLIANSTDFVIENVDKQDLETILNRITEYHEKLKEVVIKM
ncbi:MAG: helix-turn-helix domain-containing protein [Eubacterium sp.]|nr:helix-turn-helix domain-containing protein [Eubacterium sp.]